MAEKQIALHVGTAEAARVLARRASTLRAWASRGTAPGGLTPVRINGRLAWPIEGLKRLVEPKSNV